MLGLWEAGDEFTIPLFHDGRRGRPATTSKALAEHPNQRKNLIFRTKKSNSMIVGPDSQVHIGTEMKARAAAGQALSRLCP
ncbi:MAG: hypothetical protein MPJ06_03895, partial [Nitrosopumilus sp.]|nr:hypothetical protein [Nitrosopumilus sp.]